MGGCGGLERTDFEQFLLWGQCRSRCGGLERTDFKHFLFWEGVVVLKELILNNFYCGWVLWSWKNRFWTVSTLRQCDGHKRTDFEQFLLWKCVEVGVVGLKQLILMSFYFGTVCWSWKIWFWTVSILGGCGGLERTDFEQFLFLDSVLVLTELILNSFYCGRVWWPRKNWFWKVSTVGGCGCLERTDFEQFLLLDSVEVMKELILNSFYFGTEWQSWKN